MKFPKSVHAEGWAQHLDATPAASGTRPRRPGPLRGAKPLTGSAHLAAATPLGPQARATASRAADPAWPDTLPHADAALPPAPRPPAASSSARAGVARGAPAGWLWAAGTGAALVAGLAVWSLQRPSVPRDSAPAWVSGPVSAQAPATTPEPGVPADPVAEAGPAATPVEPSPPEPAGPSPVAQSNGAEGVASPAAPGRAPVGLPVTTVKPAPEAAPPRTTVAALSPPPARPDLLVRANPRSPQQEGPAPSVPLAPAAAVSALPQVATVPAAPPVAAATPLPGALPEALPSGSGPVVVPPTAAGPVATAPFNPAAAAGLPAAASAAAGQSVAAPAAPATVAPPAGVAAVPGAGLPTAQATPPASAVMPAVPEDGGITQQVRQALAADVTLAGLNLAVSTQQGVVRLEGQAPDAPTRERAAVVASSTPGVKAVDNRVTVAPPPVLSQALRQP